jgi:short subunit fatty acids transporter
VKSILRDKVSGFFFDGVGFGTSHQSKAKVIEGPLVHATVCAIYSRDVEIMSAPERCIYTFQHESGNGTFTIKAHDITEAQRKLGTIIGSHSNAYSYWSHTQTETGWMHAARILCDNGGNPA